jgi:hypothetical protein
MVAARNNDQPIVTTRRYGVTVIIPDIIRP